MLERLLVQTEHSLQSSIEDLESSNEELQATNEELLASNEELQSVNEELQSVNEELHSVNAEHQAKISELSQVTGELNQVLGALRSGLMLLDRSHRIRRANKFFLRLCGLDLMVIGQTISHVRFGFEGVEISDLVRDAESDRGEQEVVARLHDASYFLRVSTIRERDEVRGYLVTCTEFSGLEQVAELEASVVREFRNSPQPALLEDKDGAIKRFSDSLVDILGRDPRYLLGTTLEDLAEDPAQVTAAREIAHQRQWSGFLNIRFGHGASVPVPMFAGTVSEHTGDVIWRVPRPIGSDLNEGIGFVRFQTDGTAFVWSSHAKALLERGSGIVWLPSGLPAPDARLLEGAVQASERGMPHLIALDGPIRVTLYRMDGDVPSVAGTVWSATS